MRQSTELMVVVLLGAILSWLTPYPWFVDLAIVAFVIGAGAHAD